MPELSLFPFAVGCWQWPGWRFLRYQSGQVCCVVACNSSREVEEASLELKHATGYWKAVNPQTSLDLIPIHPQREVISKTVLRFISLVVSLPCRSTVTESFTVSPMFTQASCELLSKRHSERFSIGKTQSTAQSFLVRKRLFFFSLFFIPLYFLIFFSRNFTVKVCMFFHKNLVFQKQNFIIKCKTFADKHLYFSTARVARLLYVFYVPWAFRGPCPMTNC